MLPLVLAPLDMGSYSISVEPMSGPELFREAGLMFGAIGALVVAIGLGLWAA